MNTIKGFYVKNKEIIIRNINFYSNVFVFLGAAITLFTSASYIWDESGEYKHANEILTVFSAALTVLSTMTLFWSEREGEKLSAVNNDRLNLIISKLSDRMQKNVAEAEKYKYKLEKLKGQLLWRDVTEFQVNKLREILVGEEIEIWLSFVKTDYESVLYREKINNALKGTCIKTIFFGGRDRVLGLGICGTVTPNLEKVYYAFLEAGFPIKYFGEADELCRPIEIVVGSKPPIDID
ncbi:TPA: hypothetical protein ACOEGF_001775 [Enterobacter asburiae]